MTKPLNSQTLLGLWKIGVRKIAFCVVPHTQYNFGVDRTVGFGGNRGQTSKHTDVQASQLHARYDGKRRNELAMCPN